MDLVATGESITPSTFGLTGHLEPKPLFLKYPELLNAQLFEGLTQRAGFRVTYRSAFLDKNDEPFGWYYRISPTEEPPFYREADIVVLDSWTQEQVYLQAQHTIELFRD